MCKCKVLRGDASVFTAGTVKPAPRPDRGPRSSRQNREGDRWEDHRDSDCGEARVVKKWIQSVPWAFVDASQTALKAGLAFVLLETSGTSDVRGTAGSRR
jgi:hypothetical protein